MTDNSPLNDETGIAIIGMAGRFPGAANLEAFWENLRNGVESIKIFTDEELIAAGVDPALIKNPKYVKAKGLLDGADLFDAVFFGYTPREAELMDPQQRILLESSYAALENAGYDPQACEQPVGVFSGGCFNTYLLDNVNFQQVKNISGLELLISSDKDFLSTRISYKLNLKGPSITVQTACSTSLVAVSLACQSLLNYQCDMALAGGVSVKVPRIKGYTYQNEGIASPDGHCRAFDADARGTVSAEGVAMVVLKRLEEAIADGDTIHAVIKGSATNNDGSHKVGFTAPSVDGQAEVIALTQTLADVDADSISYIEAHGTGTALGDPIEIAALTQAFRTTTDRKNYCAIGSLKSNFGHLDAAAGVGGLIKTVLSLQHRQIPPSLHFKTPNPKIDFDNSPFYVNAALSEWKPGSTRRRAGVSSFGIGGTNAHIVLEEGPPVEASGPSRSELLLVLSARSASALDKVTANLATALKHDPAPNLADAAYTLQFGRRRFRYRRILICRTTQEACSALETMDPTQIVSSDQVTSERPVTFMFPGQGSQYVNMGKALYDSEFLFRDLIDQCSTLLLPELDCDLRDVLYPADAEFDTASERMSQTMFTQPALFVVEYAMARLWMQWGIKPEAMIGHSIGEYVAACLSGVMSLEDALKLVAARARLMQKLPSGAMLAVPLPPVELEARLDQGLSIAVINEPGLCVVSGESSNIEQFEQRLVGEKLVCQRLHTSHAFHSAMMDPIVEEFTQLVARTTLNAPTIPYLSNVTGTWISDEQAQNSAYWATHLRQTVRFADGIHELLQDPERLLLEVGPGTTLTSVAGRHPDRNSGHAFVSSMRHPKDQNPDLSILLKTLGQLWLQGVDIDWPAFYVGEQRHRIPLPTYPFEGQRYWLEPDRSSPCIDETAVLESVKNRERMEDWYYMLSWKRSPLSMSLPILSESDDSSRWLVFTDDTGFGQRMVEQLTNLGQTVTKVCLGAEAVHTDKGVYTLDPAVSEHYEILRNSLQGDGSPLHIVHLWGVTGNDNGAAGPSSAELISRCFYSPIYIAQILGKQELNFPVYMTMVTNQLQDVTGNEVLSEDKATLLGPCKVIPQEYPQINCGSVDIQLHKSGTVNEEQQILALLAESMDASHDFAVAYRGPHRWVQSYERLNVDKIKGTPWRLKQHGIYLVTGGLGGIGLEIACYLARTVSARLVLMSRSEFPAREKWTERLASHPDTDSISQKIKTIQSMEAAGAEVAIFSADVTDAGQMRKLIEQTKASFGSINGVIHAAGVPGGGLIQLKTPGIASTVLAPKVEGLRVLDELLGESDLDFMVLCSSLTALTGSPGQVDYTAANAYLDAFARRRGRDASTFTVSINWDAWSEVGMAVDTDAPAGFAEQRCRNLENGISSAEGVQVFAHVLNSPVSQVAVSTTALLPRVEARQSMLSLQQAGNTQAATSEKPGHALTGLSTEYVAPRNELEQTLARVWGQFIGVDQVGVHDNFFELGGHSLLAIQIITQLVSELQVDLSVNTFFEAPTITEAAVQIEQAKQQQDEAEIVAVLDMVEQLSDEEVSALMAQESLQETSEPEAAAIEKPVHARPELSTEYVAPRNELEQTLARVWGQFIGVDQVGVHDNFFELGGHSLLAIQIITQLVSELQVDLSVNTFFETPTIAEAAVLIERAKQKQDEAEISAVLDMVEQLSDEEVQALMEEDQK